MRAAIETREVITVGTGELPIWGTYHKPQDEKNRIGVLFLSGGVLPRAAAGDSAVYWADSLAKSGYLSFRFDLPGLGDSDGDLAKDENTFRLLVSKGAYAPAVCDIVNHLVERFNLLGLVVIGHCSGAVSAIYAAAANTHIKGLILLDPYFQGQLEAEKQHILTRLHLRIIRKLAWDRPAQSGLRDAGVKILSYTRNAYRRVKDIHLPVGRKRLPNNANLPLVRCWKQLASAGLRILVLNSPSLTPKPGEFDYIADLLPPSDRDCRISVKLIESATHVFAERHGKETVLKYTEQWLRACFPMTRHTGASTSHHRTELADALSGVDTNVR